MCHTGGAIQVLKKYAALWGISAEHFDPYAALRGSGLHPRRPLEEILVEHSTFSRNHLKERLYDAGLKRPICAYPQYAKYDGTGDLKDPANFSCVDPD